MNHRVRSEQQTILTRTPTETPRFPAKLRRLSHPLGRLPHWQDVTSVVVDLRNQSWFPTGGDYFIHIASYYPNQASESYRLRVDLIP